MLPQVTLSTTQQMAIRRVMPDDLYLDEKHDDLWNGLLRRGKWASEE